MQKSLITLMAAAVCSMAIELGSVPPKVVLDGKNGGNVKGGAWSSQMLKGKVYILFYIDPDERKKNKALTEALKARHFNKKRFGSVAVINLAATWLPNAILESLLEKKQKEFPRTVYVKDKERVLVKQWQLADNDADVLVFDKNGKLIYKKFGKLSDAEIQKVLSLIEKNL